MRDSSTPNKYRAILLFGMPGSGKGTQGAVLDQLPGFVHISSGELFRKLPKWGELGQEVLHCTSRGLLVPDDLTVRIYLRQIKILEMQELLLPEQHTLVLDGLPRNTEQARMLDDVLDVVQIFHLKISDITKAIDRLHSRALRENRLDDMNPEVIERRLKVYLDETYATLQFYDPSLIFDVDGAQTPLEVLCDIVNRLRLLEHERPRRADPAPTATLERATR
jgi:adenylate kinase